MHITIVTSAAKSSRAGNRITANRWAKIFRQLGHRVSIDKRFHPECDLLIGIHAEKSASQVNSFSKRFPDRKSVVVISGTDLYGQSKFSTAAKHALAAADGLVVLESMAKQQLPTKLQSKTTIIHQSAIAPRTKPEPLKSCFEISICGHLRPEKDPFLVAEAIKLLPDQSRIKVTHIGKPLSIKMKRMAAKLTKTLPRYRWVGEKEHWKARQLIARSRLMINTSKMESSSNSVIEAIAAVVPVVATNVPGNTGVFGAEYTGLFSVGDYNRLAALLRKFERDKTFQLQLKKQCRVIAKKFSSNNEQTAWRDLLFELFENGRLLKPLV